MSDIFSKSLYMSFEINPTDDVGSSDEGITLLASSFIKSTTSATAFLSHVWVLYPIACIWNTYLLPHKLGSSKIDVSLSVSQFVLVYHQVEAVATQHHHKWGT